MFIAVLLMFYSCSKESDYYKRLNAKFEEKVDLIDSLRSFQLNKGLIAREQGNSNLRIVTYIDSTCSQCVEELENWKRYIADELNKDVQVLFFIRTLKLDSLERSLSKVQFELPVIVDFDNSFINVNEISSNKIEQTYLIDDENKVLLIGNPLYSSKIRNLYSSTISSFK